MDVKPILAALAELQLRDLGTQDNHRAIAAQAESMLDVVPETLRTLLGLIVEELAGAKRNGRHFAELPVEERGVLLSELWADPQRAARIGQVTRLVWLVIYSRPPARETVGFKPLDAPPAAVAPIVGTARVASAAGNIARALGLALDLAELEEEAEADA